MKCQHPPEESETPHPLDISKTTRGHEHALLILDTLPFCYVLLNTRLEMVNCNRATVDFFQCVETVETRKRVLKMFPERQPDGRLSAEAARFELNNAFTTGYHKVEWTFLLPSGELVPAEIIAVKVTHGDEDMLAVYARDLREEKALRAAHNEAHERIRLMFDAMPFCCNLWNEQYNNIDCNLEAVRLFGLSSKNEYLNRFAELSPEKQPDGEASVQKARRFIKRAFEIGHHRFEWMHQKLNGTPMPAEVTLVRIKMGSQYIVAGYTRDLREEKSLLKAKAAAMHEAQTDPLTRLYNKTAVKLLINNVLNSSDADNKHALICIDLDNFKSINDAFGHLFGDEVLTEVSKQIKRVFRSSDILGRFGGDEFILFIKDIPSIEFINAKAEVLCTQIRKTYRVEGVAHTVSASIGISIYPDDGTSYSTLYQNADAASYCAKRAGKNQYALWANCAHHEGTLSTHVKSKPTKT